MTKSYMTSNSVFVDTSWFKALLDQKDDFHARALKQSISIEKAKLQLVTTNYIVDESLTLLRQKSGLDLALKFRDSLVDMRDYLKFIRVTPQDETKAWDWFPKDRSKLSFTDCTSFAAMKRLGLKDVATFDDHFARAGFNMLS